MKTCKTCKIVKNINNFYKNKANKDGFRGKCKKCFSIYRKIYYKKNREKKLLIDKISYQKRRSKILNQKQKYYQINKEKILLKTKTYQTNNQKPISKRRKIFYQRNKPKILQKRKQYRMNNKEIIAKKAKISHQLHREDRLNYRYKKEYGLSYQDVKNIFNKIGGKCPLCEKNMHMEEVNDSRAVVDHNHQTGIIRGIICSQCNKGIGHFNDDPELLLRVVDYLQNSLLTKPKESAKVVDTNTV